MSGSAPEAGAGDPRLIHIRETSGPAPRVHVVAGREPTRVPVPAKERPAAGIRVPTRRAPPMLLSRRYQTVELLSHGGRGTVYKATDKLLNMTVAIKVLPEGFMSDVSAVDAFKREAAVAMNLAHENIVRLYNLELEGGRLFLVMEFVDGENFAGILSRVGRLSLDTVLDVSTVCASALGYVHARGVLHRDLKPENLMLTRDAILKIVDFGLATPVAPNRTAADLEFLQGTPGYMSPEEICGLPLDVRTDVYSLGAILAEMLGGQPVFPREPGTEIENVLELEPAVSDLVHPAVAAALRKALAKDPTDRWSSVAELDAALRAAAGPGRASATAPG